ncbi:hypothetical protein MRB53_034466 [Persea americana]|uniref:Uncharacterized protein n=1 Tax=Persea americana TaxID=3435 RepID=A0ACC2K1Z0_PERAE|nr:hypothetical protein MRB53_034466 [Persea americana]
MLKMGQIFLRPSIVAWNTFFNSVSPLPTILLNTGKEHVISMESLVIGDILQHLNSLVERNKNLYGIVAAVEAHTSTLQMLQEKPYVICCRDRAAGARHFPSQIYVDPF